MDDTQKRLVMAGGFFFSFVLVELLVGVFKPKTGSRRQTILDVLAASQAWFLAGPMVAFASAWAIGYFLPKYEGAWAGTHWALASMNPHRSPAKRLGISSSSRALNAPMTGNLNVISDELGRNMSW